MGEGTVRGLWRYRIGAPTMSQTERLIRLPPAEVWVVLHDAGVDYGLSILAVYATKADAEAAAAGHKDGRCCLADRHEVL